MFFKYKSNFEPIEKTEAIYKTSLSNMNDLCLVRGNRQITPEDEKNNNNHANCTPSCPLRKGPTSDTGNESSNTLKKNDETRDKGLLPEPALLPFNPSYLDALRPNDGKKQSTPKRGKSPKQSRGLKTRGLSGLITSLRRGEINFTIKSSINGSQKTQ